MPRLPGNSRAPCTRWRSGRKRRVKQVGPDKPPQRDSGGPMTAQKLIVLTGLPGSGKSTLANGLSRSLSMPVFSVDPIEAAMRRSGLAEAQTGIAAYNIAVTLADEHLTLGHSVIIDAVNPAEAPRPAWRNL